MYRKQKSDKLLIIGDFNGYRQDQCSRIQSIKIAQNEAYKNGKYKQINMANLVRIYSQESYIAVIDKNQDAWLIGELFPNPINISDLIRKKINRVFLGEKEMIAETKNQYILINWGSVKTLNQNLLKISTFNTSQNDSLFIAYLITSAEKGTFFYYSLEKKVENSNRLFEIRNCTKEIIGYPTNKSIETNIIVKGISVGKYHSLCWDHQGNLYSWGCRSLALGYGHLPSQDLIEKPTKIKMNKYILMAYAATHYSLAVTSQGCLYEWGIKMEFNEINQQLIFKPRQLDFRFFNCNAKFISLKGRDNNFAALSSSGELYVWGLTAKSLLDPSIALPASWQGTYIYEPVLQTDLLNCKIIDFAVEVNYISVLLGSEGSNDHPEEDYWKILKEKAKVQLFHFKNNRISTENNEQLRLLRKKYKNPILCDNHTQRKHISIRAEDKSVKHNSRMQKYESLENLKINTFKKTAPTLTNQHWPTPQMSSAHKRQVSDCFGYISPFDGKINSHRCSEANLSKKIIDSKRQNRFDHKFSQIYNIKLQGMLQKKRRMQSLQLQTHLRRIDEGSVEFRQRKKEQQQTKRLKQQQQLIIKTTIREFCIKAYLVKMVTDPLQEARNIKIGNFKRVLVMNKVEKNIKKLFSDIKIKFIIQEMQKQKLSRFILLALYFKNYVIKFRQRKRESMKWIVIQSLVKLDLKQKIHLGILNISAKAKRINKLTEWLHTYNKQRMKILKQLWNTFILGTLKTSQGGKFNLHNLNTQATFQQKYEDALQNNTMTRLCDYYKGLKRFNLRSGTKKSLADAKRRGNVKFAQQLKDKLSSVQILPYSLHYNSFKRPKQLQIVINQAVKTSACWVETQRKMVKEILQSIIRKHDRQFVIRYRQYQLDLANYIQTNYENFYQMRWKFILEYNKMEKTLQKRKKQKQLRRLLSKVGMQRLVDEDCIPEKYIVLQQALLRRDAPRPPSSILQFDMNKFDRFFKNYWESIQCKAKQIRKKNL